MTRFQKNTYCHERSHHRDPSIEPLYAELNLCPSWKLSNLCSGMRPIKPSIINIETKKKIIHDSSLSFPYFKGLFKNKFYFY